MDDAIHSRAVSLAGGLVLATATIHVFMGVAGIIDPTLVNAGTTILPWLFLMAAIAAYATVGLYQLDVLPPTLAYAVGAMLMVAYILAYVDWHVLHIGEVALGFEYGHAHDGHHHVHGGGSALAELAAHLRADPVALVSKAIEVTAAGMLVSLILGQLRRRSARFRQSVQPNSS